MRRICMDCKADLGDVPGPDDQVSHGICFDCLPARYRELYMEIAAELALNVANEKLERARIDKAPPTYCAAIEATAQEIAEALRNYKPAVTA